MSHFEAAAQRAGSGAGSRSGARTGDAELEAARRVHRALGDTNRLKVVRRLAEGASSVSGLVDACNLPQTLVSWHLRKLRMAGLVTTERVGRERIYTLRPETIAEGHALMLDALGLLPERTPSAWVEPAAALPGAARLVAALADDRADD